jgi:hypothetical protein
VALSFTLGATTAPAQAATSSPTKLWTDEGREAVKHWAAKGAGAVLPPGDPGSIAPPSSAVDPITQALAEDEKLRFTAEMEREAWKLRRRTGLITGAKVLASTAGRVTMGATAFSIGWAIGSSIAGELYQAAEVPALPPPGTYRRNPPDIAEAGEVMGMANGIPVEAPEAVWMLSYMGIYAPFVSGVSGVSCGSGFAPVDPPPAEVVAAMETPGAYAVTVPVSQQCSGYTTGPNPEFTFVPGQAYVVVAPVDMSGPSDVHTPTDESGGRLATPVDSRARSLIDTEIDSPTFDQDYPNLGPRLRRAAGLIDVPTCRGLTYAECVVELEQAGFTVSPTRVDLDFDGADATVPAQHVVRTAPADGAHVRPSTPVEIQVNPAPEDMPVIVPPPKPGETPEDYRQRLIDLGLVVPPFVILTPETLDPGKGPDEIVRTRPAPTTRVGIGTSITVYVNPPTAPPVPGTVTPPAQGPPGDPSAPPGTCELPSIRAIDLGPLSIDVGQRFPFGIFGWLSGILGGLVAGGVAPHVSIPMPGSIDDLVIDLDRFSPIWDVIHPVMLICAFISLAYLLASVAMGLGRPSDD